MKLKFNFDWICHDIEFDFSLLRDFHNDLHKSLPLISSKVEEDIETYLGKITDEDEYNAVSSSLTAEHYTKFEEIYPNQLSYNFLVSLYSTIEANITKLCDDIVARRKLPFSLEAFSGHLPDKIRHFFMAFNLPPMEDNEVQVLKELTKLRNSIVHKAGKISEQEKSLRNLVNKTQHLKIESGSIIIEYPYCIEMYNKIIAIFRSIFARLGYRTTYTVSRIP